MRKLLSAALLSLGLLGGGVAQAEVARLYFGAGFADGTVDIANGSEKSLGTLTGSAGLQLLDFIGVEFNAGYASDQRGSLLSEPLVSYQAVLLRLGYRWDRTGIYVLGGQARLDVDKKFNNSNAGVVYGFGINLFGNETTALNFHVIDIDSGAFTSASIGFQYYIGGFR